MNSIGIYVPGGTASYPSSILMNSIPAKIAGVDKIIMVTPQSNEELDPIIAKAAEIANEGITLEYESGSNRTTLEIIQSRSLLLDARTSFAGAQKDFAIAKFILLASIGDLYLNNIN